MRLLRIGEPSRRAPGRRETTSGSMPGRSPPTSTARSSPAAAPTGCAAALARRGAARLVPGGTAAGRRAGRPARQGRVHRAQLPRPRGRDRAAPPGRADRVHEGPRHRGRPGRRGAASRAARTKTDWEVELGRRHRAHGPLPGLRPTRPRPSSPATRSPTTSPSASSSSSAAASGTRASTARRSTRSARGWSPPTRSPTRRRSACGCGSTASCARTARTADMIFDVAYLVWYLSQFMVLYPGDVINTGTPAGVALGLPGQPYLRAGDVVRAGDRRPGPPAPDGLGRHERPAIDAGVRPGCVAVVTGGASGHRSGDRPS